MSRRFDHGYALLIAVDQNDIPEIALPDVAKDVLALRTVLIDPGRCGYWADHVRVVDGKDSTRAGILAGLAWLGDALQADSSDNATAVVYYTGHGHCEGGAYYLIPRDVRRNWLTASALPAEDIARGIAALKPRRLLVMLDCCHAAGMNVKDVAVSSLALNDSAIPAAWFMQAGLGAPPAASSAKGFDALAQGAGRAVLSSSQANQRSWMRRDRAMSIFTYHVIEALTGHALPQAGATEVLVSDVMSHVHRRVPASARAECGVEQQPDYQVSGNFPVALLLGGKGLSQGDLAPDPLNAALDPPADQPTYQATATGGSVVAQGAGAVAVGPRGVYIGGQNTGPVNGGR